MSCLIAAIVTRMQFLVSLFRNHLHQANCASAADNSSVQASEAHKACVCHRATHTQATLMPIHFYRILVSPAAEPCTGSWAASTGCGNFFPAHAAHAAVILHRVMATRSTQSSYPTTSGPSARGHRLPGCSALPLVWRA